MSSSPKLQVSSFYCHICNQIINISRPSLSYKRKTSENIFTVVQKNHRGRLPVQSPFTWLSPAPPPSPPLPGGQRNWPRPWFDLLFLLLQRCHFQQRALFFPRPAPGQGPVSPTPPFHLIPQNKQVGNQFPFHLKNLLLIPLRKLMVGAQSNEQEKAIKA